MLPEKTGLAMLLLAFRKLDTTKLVTLQKR